jgi:PAS domain S-box-containing protein
LKSSGQGKGYLLAKLSQDAFPLGMIGSWLTLKCWVWSMLDFLAIYSESNRRRNLLVAAAFIVAIAILDWWTKPYLSLGFLYLFPIMLVAGFLKRWQLVGVSLLCSALQEVFSNLPTSAIAPRLAMVCVGYVGTGLFVSELVSKRKLVARHVADLEAQIRFRRDAEQQLEALIESSPAAIVTVDSNGQIERANQAAQQLLASEGPALRGQSISAFLPALQTIVRTYPSKVFRTSLQSQGHRFNGEVFLAAVWFSTYTASSGPRLAAIIVDLSEDVRDREQLSLDHLLKNARIMMAAVSHEIRNLCGAISVVHQNLSHVKGLEKNRDFVALGTLVEGLEKIAALDLKPATEQAATPVELATVLDELRILIEPTVHEAGAHIDWRVDANLPMVWADRYGLMQVFLNLVKNSNRAMEGSSQKRLTISAGSENQHVVVRFEDTGHGVADPEELFRPFQRKARATGLGLYVSRAILRTFGGELQYEPRGVGCCFGVSLTSIGAVRETIDARKN